MSQIDLPRRHHLDAITSERWTASDQNRWTPSVRYAWTASLESADHLNCGRPRGRRDGVDGIVGAGGMSEQVDIIKPLSIEDCAQIIDAASARAVVREQSALAAVGRHCSAIGNHTFRATGITNFLENGGTLEHAHASPRTTRLYDGRKERITQAQVERIRL
jgi:hypothetical protein